MQSSAVYTVFMCVRTFKAIEDDLAFRPLVLNMMHVFFLPNLELIASYHKTL